jgi:hypothetical protein
MGRLTRLRYTIRCRRGLKPFASWANFKREWRWVFNAEPGGNPYLSDEYKRKLRELPEPRHATFKQSDVGRFFPARKKDA